jgi:cation/acetate symporter
LYTTAPAVAAFARINIIESIDNVSYSELPHWFKRWEEAGLLAWLDKNRDGDVQYRGGAALSPLKPIYSDKRGLNGERELTNEGTSGPNELYIDRDIIVLAHPEIAKLPDWVVALVAAGGLAAALSTAAGLLLVISTAISHDLLKNIRKAGASLCSFCCCDSCSCSWIVWNKSAWFRSRSCRLRFWTSRCYFFPSDFFRNFP